MDHQYRCQYHPADAAQTKAEELHETDEMGIVWGHFRTRTNMEGVTTKPART